MRHSAVEASKNTEQTIMQALLQGPLDPIRPDLDLLEKSLPELIPAQSKTASEVILHVFRGGGKRIRPALFFMTARMFGYDGEHKLPIAGVCEYVHTASLLHDDVVDNSQLRRNRPTANSIWGDETCVLVGDLIYSAASELMAATGNLELVETFSKAIRLMSEGELLQLSNLYNFDLTTDDYFKVLSLKTGCLIAASCKSAALLAQATPEESGRLEDFGHFLGMSFQLIDDALDYSGNREVFGKATLADLKEGKVTLPIILLRERASEEEKELVKSLVNVSKHEPSKLNSLLAMIKKYDCIEDTLKVARDYTDKATDLLRKFPTCSARDHMEMLTRWLTTRVV